MSFPPTAEQQAALAAFATGANMVIEAGAGTGKTTTLRLLAESAPERTGIYIAYNKAIATDAAASFPSSVKCKTAHSLAFGPVGSRYKHRLNGDRVPSRQQVEILGIPQGGFEISPEQVIPAWIVARLASETVGRYCNSADDKISERHVPKVPGVEEGRAALATYVAKFAKVYWDDIVSKTGKLSFQHDHYLKIWALTKPKLNCQYVMLDEAQDANPVIAKIVEDQDCQQVMVGDRCQAIYGWRGAVDAMTTFKTDHRLILSKSFRFGAAVAAEANVWLDALDSPLRLEGFEKIASTVSDSLLDPDAILCRTNATVIAQAMSAQASGKKVAIVGGTREIERFTKGAQDLMDGRSSSHGDLATFKSWGEVVSYVGEPEGADLRVMVRLIETYGTEAILAVCRASVDEAGADLIVSTAHKAKGREWDKVRLANDFGRTEEGEPMARAEMMLVYVAVTRAKLVLDHSGLLKDEVAA